MATKRAGLRARSEGGGADAAKRALIVAINDYGNPQNDLPSCLKDAAQFRATLQSHYGFADFTELYDADATVANVESGLAWLLDDVAPDDRLVFYYSGHGYQQPRNGNLEECLVLGNLEFLFDDRLSELSQAAPPGTLSVILNSCFSGGMDKRVLLGERVEVARTKLWVPPPDAPAAKRLSTGPLVPRPFGCQPITSQDAVKRLILGAETKAAGTPTAGSDEANQLLLNALLLSACSENETSSASTSATQGMSAFTYALMRMLPASGAISNAQLGNAARGRLAAMGFRQTPLLRAPARPAGLADASFATLIPVTGATGDQRAKSLPTRDGREALNNTTQETGGTLMVSNQTSNNPANDEQFWQTVERVAAQVVTSARGEAPVGPKGFAPDAQSATSPPANQPDGEAAGQRPGRVTALPTGGTAAGNRGNGQTPPQRVPSDTDAGEGDQQSTGTEQPGSSSAPGIAVGEGVDQGEQKWIGAALSLAATVAPMVIDAFRKRRKDFMPDGADGDEKLMNAVTDAVTPAIIDAIAGRPKDFTLDLPADASGEDGAEGDSKFPWGAVARVVASAVPSLVGELARRKGLVPDVAADPVAGEDDRPSGMVAGAVAPAVITAMARRRKDIGATMPDGSDAALGDDKGIPWGAIARIAASVVPSVVGELTRRKILTPGMQPSQPMRLLPLPAGMPDRSDRRYYAA